MASCGGLTFNLSRLAINLKKVGHKVVVVSEPGEEENGLFEDLIHSGIKYHKLYGLETLSMNMIAVSRTVGEIIDCHDIDVIHAQGIRDMLVAFLSTKVFSHKKARIVVSIHSLLHGTPYEKMATFFGSMLLNLCADLVMPVAETVTKKMITFGLLKNKAITVYNGFDLDFFDRCVRDKESALQMKYDSSQILIGYVAYLVPRKGHKYLVNAFYQVLKCYPNAKLILVGGGPLKNELQVLVKELRLEQNVIFTGRIKYADMYRLLHYIDIYAFPSVSELFPFAILEAMAAEKPIVATDVGGVPEVVKDGTGILVPPQDYIGIAEGIKKLIQNPTEAKQMGRKCRKLLEEKFNLPKIAFDLTKCYNLALTRGK